MAITIKDAFGVNQTVETPAAISRAAAGSSKPVALSTEDLAAVNAITSILGAIGDAGSATTTIKAVLRFIAQTGIPITAMPALGTGTNNIGDVDVLTVPVDPFGLNANAADVAGSISAKLRALATAVGAAVITRGIGASDANTIRTHTTIDPAQLSPLVVSSVPVITGGYLYKACPANTSTVLQETTGAIGDYLEHLVCRIADVTTCHVHIGDAGTSFVALDDNIDVGKGTIHLAYGIRSRNGAWTITCGTGVEVIATGRWT
jgi:hypothetical protein